MPLSENEQQILREIEDDLSATDPKLLQQVTDATLYRHRARLIKWSVGADTWRQRVDHWDAPSDAMETTAHTGQGADRPGTV